MPKIFRLGGPGWPEEFVFYSESSRTLEDWDEAVRTTVGETLGQLSFHEPPAPREWVRRLEPGLAQRGFILIKAPLVLLDERTGKVRSKRGWT